MIEVKLLQIHDHDRDGEFNSKFQYTYVALYIKCIAIVQKMQIHKRYYMQCHLYESCVEQR